MESQNAVHFHHPHKVINSASAVKERRGRKLKIGASLEALKYEEPPPRSSCNLYLKDLMYQLLSIIYIIIRY